MNIFVTRKIPEKGLQMLTQRYNVEINPENRVLRKQEIIEGVRGKDGLLCLLTDPIDKDVIEAEPSLKMIASYAVGYDNIDVAAATALGIPVCNTPGVLTDATAEMTWALIYAVARHIVKGDQFTREGKFRGWGPLLLLGQQLQEKTLGIIGAGRIGTAVGLKSRGLAMKVVYVSSHQNQVLEKETSAQKVTLSKLLKISDVISLHVPLTKKTEHLIGAAELSQMKTTAILINTSRGPVIDEQALIKALQNKTIYGAGLDVYEQEPHVPKELRELENVVLQPHAASATVESRTNMAVLAAKNMIAGLNGSIPPNCINPDVFD